MPLRDHIKALKSEFNNIKQEVKKYQGQPQGQQSSNSLGQGQQQGYGGHPQQSQGHHGAQYNQQQYQTPQGQNYQAPAWQVPNQTSQQARNQQHRQGSYGGTPQQDQQYSGGPHQQQQQQQAQYQQLGAAYPASPLTNPHQQQFPSPPAQQQQPNPHLSTFSPPPGQHGAPPHPQQHHFPPPVPYGSHPGSPPPHQPPQHSNPTTYYHPQFHPSTPVSTYFEHKLGNNNGWGNAELQHYTSSPSNSFHTPSNKLIVRAVSQPKHPDASQRYTSARLRSHQNLDKPSGCLTAVITSPSAPGIWPAFWLLPCEPFSWPSDGEIDIAESWNAGPTNHTCLHWGHFNGLDSQKHRVVATPLPNIGGRAVKYEFCWQQDDSGRGRMLWLIDGQAVMKASIPDGVRRLREWNVVVNVAMGGNVCEGKMPGAGTWEMVVHEVRMSAEPDGGWGRVEGLWKAAREGNTM